MKKDRIYLIGFMGVGKTTVAETFALKTGCKWIDTDAFMEEQEKCSVQEIFARKGEEYFRKLETEVLLELSKDMTNEPQKGSETSLFVISCGGGVVLKPENVACMKENGFVVYLRARLETLENRLQTMEGRPVLQVGKLPLKERVAELMKQRSALYEAAADEIIDTDDISPVEIVEKLLG